MTTNDVLFYVARHGETTWNAIKRIQGQKSYYKEEDGRMVAVTLTEMGRQQAERLGVKLRTIEFSRCYSSDLLRALDTAMIVTRDRIFPVIDDARLRERSRGKWEGKFEADFAKAPPVDKTDVESDESMLQRLMSFFNQAAEEHRGEKVLVIAHERVITNLVVKLLNLPCKANDISVDHAGLLQIRHANGTMRVQAMEGISLYRTEVLKDEMIDAHIPRLAELSQIYREWPYCTQLDDESYRGHVRKFRNSPTGILCVAYNHANRVIGAIMGRSLAEGADRYKNAFNNKTFPPNTFHVADCLVDPDFRGRHVAEELYKTLEKTLKGYSQVSLAVVHRPADFRIAEPAGARKPHELWQKLGFQPLPQSEGSGTYETVWPLTDDGKDFPNPMHFWIRTI